MRYISFSLTEPQFLDGSKDVTRRVGWKNAQRGDVLMAARKCQGIKKGEKVHALGPIRADCVRREPLRRMTDDPVYGKSECIREGFPNLTAAEFVAFFCKSHRGCTPDTVATRIQFRKLKCTI